LCSPVNGRRGLAPPGGRLSDEAIDDAPRQVSNLAAGRRRGECFAEAR
jgi:hypothetical protein